MLGYGLLALSGQHRQSGAEFYFLDQSPEGTSEANLLDRVFRCVPTGLHVVRGHELTDNMECLGDELKARLNGERGGNAPPIFVFISGLQKFKKLRQEDDFSFGSGDSSSSNPAGILAQIINEGSAQGIHLVVTIDTFNNIGRWLSRKALTEFEMRVVFQMSANDSASLIDSPAAGTLGIHRALLYNEQQGSHETFRPYAPPENSWLELAAQQLKA
jgi:hypothetical protein